MSLSDNRLILTGQLLERGPLRRTPAGVALIEFKLRHVSEQMEADMPRQIECELDCVAMGTPALLMTGGSLSGSLTVTGFLAARSIKRRAPVLHITEIEFLEGNKNGF